MTNRALHINYVLATFALALAAGCVAKDPGSVANPNAVKATIAQSPSGAGGDGNTPVRRVGGLDGAATLAATCAAPANGVVSCTLSAGDTAFPLSADARKQVITLRNDGSASLRVGGIEDEASYCAWIESSATPASGSGVRCLESIVGASIAPGAALSLSIVSETAPSQVFISVSAGE